MIRILLAILALIILAYWMTAPSNSDVEACMDKTGWNAARCSVELNR